MKYRKKPIIVEAIQLDNTQQRIKEVLEFMGQRVDLENRITSARFDNYCDMVLLRGGVEIDTFEGTMKANIGDYIIKGVNGEFYPCKPDIFEKTYEVVE